MSHSTESHSPWKQADVEWLLTADKAMSMTGSLHVYKDVSTHAGLIKDLDA